MPKRATGFTLLEVLAVVALLSIVLMALGLSLRPALLRAQARGIGERWASIDLRLRKQATASGLTVGLFVGVNDDPVQVVVASRKESIDLLATPVRCKSSNPQNANHIRFYPDGTSDDYRLELHGPAGQRIVVNVEGLSGKVQIELPRAEARE